MQLSAPLAMTSLSLNRQEKALSHTSRGLLYLFGVTKFLLPAKSVASEGKKFVTLSSPKSVPFVLIKTAVWGWGGT